MVTHRAAGVPERRETGGQAGEPGGDRPARLLCRWCGAEHSSETARLDCFRAARGSFAPGSWHSDPERRAASLKRAGELGGNRNKREAIYRKWQREALARKPAGAGVRKVSLGPRPEAEAP
jgi:hypothetical protein